MIVVWCALGVVARFLVDATDPARPRFLSRIERLYLLPFAVHYVAAAALIAAVALIYAGSVMDAAYNVWDDNMAYRSFASQFLDTGTLYEPFSYRRIGAYGGQSFLQAMVLALSDRDRLHIADNGIAVVLIAGMILGYPFRERRGARAATIITLLLFVTFPYPPENSGAALTGVALFVALFRFFDSEEFAARRSVENAIFVGLITAGVCTLRQTFLSASFAFIGLVYVFLFASQQAKTRRAWLRELGLSFASTFAWLSPWLVLSYQTARTPWYPLIKGNMRSDFGIIGKVAFDEELRWAFANLFTPRPLVTITLFFVAGFLLPPTRRNRAVHALMLACAAAFAVMMHFFQTFHLPDSIARYHFAFTAAFALLVTLRASADVSSRENARRASVAAIVVVAAIAIHMTSAKDAIIKLYLERISAFCDIFQRPDLSRREPVATGVKIPPERTYVRMQTSVPPGTKLLVMLDHTYLLDGKRNRLLHYDHPGAMGPPPGVPVFQGPEAFASYMLSQGVRYVAYQLGPTSVEYHRPYWEERLAIVVPANGRGGFYKNQARFHVDGFDTLTALSKSRKLLFDEGEYHVIDLETRAP
jgi:hypothetical protein